MKPNQIAAASALEGIRNGLEDFEHARGIFINESPYMTVLAARLADDMCEAFDANHGAANPDCFEYIASTPERTGAGARMLASFGAMAKELRRLQDENAELNKTAAANDGAERRRVELVAQLDSARGTLDSLLYDIGELPARLLEGDIPAAASLIRSLPDVKEAIREAESVLGDNR
jgi:hypothetical protein